MRSIQNVILPIVIFGATICLANSESREFVPVQWEDEIVSNLTEEQMESFLAGTDPSEILLSSGDTLADLIRQLENQEGQGLLFYPVAPCVLHDSAEDGGTLEDGEVHPIWFQRLEDSSLEVERASCGAEAREVSAQVALLTVQVIDAEGPGELLVGPGDSRDSSRLQLSTGGIYGWTITSELCEGGAASTCPEGDLRFSVEGTSAKVVLHLIGFYSPVPQIAIRGIENEHEEVGELKLEKSLNSPFWEVGTNAGKIHYSDGFVGIGTDTPWAPLHVIGSDADYPGNRALTVQTGGESPNYRDHIKINGTAESGYGMAFGGLGHHRGGLYARNVGGASDSEGEITLWARNSGSLRLLGGKVGIGHTNPQSKLHVKGDVRFDIGEGIRFLGASNYWGTNLDARKVLIRDGNDSNGNVDGGLVFETWTEKDSQSFPLLSLRRKSGSPRIGIGSAFPGGALRIHGYRNLATGTISSVGIAVSGTGTAFESELRVGSEVIVNGQVRQVTRVIGPSQIEVNNPFVPEIDNQPFWYTHKLMIVDNAGNLGLGNIVPSEKVDVDGNIRASGQVEGAKVRVASLPSDDTTPSNSSIDIYSREEGGGLHRWAFHSASVGGGWGVVPNSLTIWEYDGRSCESENPVCEARMVFQPNTGFIGIGTDQPSARLDVVGDIELTGDLRHEADLNIESSGNLAIRSGGDICIGQCG